MPQLSRQKMKIGVDLGGSKIEAILLDAAGVQVWRERVPTPQNDYAAILQATVALVHAAEDFANASCSVGLGTPGSVSPATGLMRNSNTQCLNGKALQKDLEAMMERPLRIANDANCFALSEAVDGGGAGAKVVFGVILGTGVGGGVVIDRHVLLGANAISGEWGHNPLQVDAAQEPPLCYCGRHGCVETWLSGPGLAADHARTTGVVADAPELVERAAEGDADSDATLVRYEKRLACALATVINIVDPDVIVLGGGLSNIERLYRNVPKWWGAHIFSDTVRTRLARNRHGDSSGVRGAAWLWD
ncbi:MAG TPA: ROK family protein [Burkholderiales bacterium]|jgi:fructokinase|nr:ROK family protein [Burkholderiales bacterium]